MPSCRHCADKIMECKRHDRANGPCERWVSLTGFPCKIGHAHEPWPDLLYVESPSELEGVSIMRLVSSPPTCADCTAGIKHRHGVKYGYHN